MDSRLDDTLGKARLARPGTSLPDRFSGRVLARALDEGRARVAGPGLLAACAATAVAASALLSWIDHAPARSAAVSTPPALGIFGSVDAGQAPLFRAP